MKLAFTIGSYRLTDFVKLGIKQIKRLSNESEILVSDDPSRESNDIKKVCEEEGCQYRGARTRRGHFASDFQSLVNSLAFAESRSADVAIKISQRLVLRTPEAIDVIQKVFSNPNIMLATPGQPKILYGGKQQKSFGAFTTLSDIVMIRVGSISPSELLHMYRERIIREQVPWASFIECTVDQLHSDKFQGKSVKVEEFTNPTKEPMYLRRYQSSERHYRDLALTHDFNGHFPLAEWGAIENRNYLCRPAIV